MIACVCEWCGVGCRVFLSILRTLDIYLLILRLAAGPVWKAVMQERVAVKLTLSSARMTKDLDVGRVVYGGACPLAFSLHEAL